MPFGTITGSISGQTFEPRSPGVYALSSLTFADPVNEFRIRGASTKRDGSRSGAITRVWAKETTVNGAILRPQLITVLDITIQPNGFSLWTPTEIDSVVADISGLVTASTISRFLQGES